MANFVTNRSLLNQKFEGYKLSPLGQDDHVLRFPLTAHPTQANVSGRSRTPLSFEEVQSRITHNHLTISYDSTSAVYIDDDLNVIRVTLNSDLTPTFSTFSELPKPIQTDDTAEDRHKEYPSAVSFEGWWLVSDGMGLLYVLSESKEGDRIVALYHLPNSDNTSTYLPFRIHAARLRSVDTAVCVLSCRHPGSLGSSEAEKEGAKHPLAHFDVLLVEIPIRSSQDEPNPLKVIWKARGDDVPMHVSYDTSRDAFFILGKSLYRGVGDTTLPTYEPTPDELAPIPRAGEVLAGEVLPDEVLPDGPSKPPPYSWTQTGDSVTIAFPIPTNVPKSAIHVTITAKTLSILVKHELPTGFDAELPRYSLKELWDEVNPGDCFWTLDREPERQREEKGERKEEGGREGRRFGLLTLHLDKKNEGTRWSQVFASAGKNPSHTLTDPTDTEVPETLDPNELYIIREALEKYTSSIQKGVRGEDMSGLGLGSGIPSLAEGELDDVADSEVGRRGVLSWVGVDGENPVWSLKEEGVGGGGVDLKMLSLPVPGIGENEPSLVIKNDIDGLLFTLPPIPSSPSPSPDTTTTAKAIWTHKSTYPALSFVLASKRDLRFTFHISSSLVLAFESGASSMGVGTSTGMTLGGGNVYLYYGQPQHHDQNKPGSKETWAKQSVLRTSGGESGALLGVGALKNSDGGFVLLCLCEKEMIVVKDVV